MVHSAMEQSHGLFITDYLFTARVKVKHRFLEELTCISEDTPLKYIIPTTTGPGACSLALVDYLVLQHNTFIDWCQKVVVGDDKR